MEIIDATHLLGDPPPFWMIGRPWEPNPKNLVAIERQCALMADVKAAEDFGCGLIYASAEDAAKVMALMSVEEPDASFFVVGDERRLPGSTAANASQSGYYS